MTTSPVGESPSIRFRLPFDETQLELLLLRLDPGRSGTRRAAGSAQAQACLDLGSALFDAVFVDDLRLAWTRSQDLARQQGDGLRLRLRLSEAPAIAGLPWELLHDRRSNAYLAQWERTPVVRYLEASHPLVRSWSPARCACWSSSPPTDLPELDVEQEWRRVQDALAARVSAGRIHVDRLEVPTKQALRDWLRVKDVHILHFIGHGDFDEQLQDGVVYFTDRFGRSAKVSPSTLGPDLRDHDPLRLVVLNACHSARVDTADPYSGMAQGLVQQDCAAVVAMQFPVSDGAAVTFTGEFYRSLADGFPVDQAATSARKAMLDEYATEWATPVVFLRAPDGQVLTSSPTCQEQKPTSSLRWTSRRPISSSPIRSLPRMWRTPLPIRRIRPRRPVGQRLSRRPNRGSPGVRTKRPKSRQPCSRHLGGRMRPHQRQRRRVASPRAGVAVSSSSWSSSCWSPSRSGACISGRTAARAPGAAVVRAAGGAVQIWKQRPASH